MKRLKTMCAPALIVTTLNLTVFGMCFASYTNKTIITEVPVDELRVSARKLLSSFKIPTVWLCVESDDDIPRGGTGKVDVAALRQLLTTRSEARQ